MILSNSYHNESLEEQKNKDFWGEFIDEELFQKIVKGEIDPSDYKPLKLDSYSEASIDKVAKITIKPKSKEAIKRYAIDRKYQLFIIISE